MHIHDIISAARAAAPALPDTMVLDAVVFHPTESEDDANEETREKICIALNQHLLPEDHRFIRYLFEQEMALHDDTGEAIFDNLKRCAYLLYRLGHVEDSQLLWEAKNIHFDTFAGLDIQLLTGAGLDATIAYLKTQPDTAEVLEYLDSCRRAGDFNDMTAYNRFIAAYIDDLQHY